METEVLNAYKKAGTVWKECMALARKKAKEGMLFLDLANEIEKLIAQEGARPAFPINLSVNEEAAHFTPMWKDEKTLNASDLLKVDIGVSVDGYICDGAISINLDNKHAKQIEANTLALQNAITKAEFGKPIERIGAEIEKTLKEKGFNPVYNLGGHGLGKNNIHSWPSIPNHAGGSEEALPEAAIAIEPFASSGEGNVSEVRNVEIFMLEEKASVRNNYAREILKAAEKFEGRPFAERWIRQELQLTEETSGEQNTKSKTLSKTKKLTDFQITFGLKELMKAGCVQSFPGLKEAPGAMVTQVEKTVIILEGKSIVLGE